MDYRFVQIIRITYFCKFDDIKVKGQKAWHIESCLGSLHTFGEVVKCVIFDYVLGEPWCFMCIGELGKLCTW